MTKICLFVLACGAYSFNAPAKTTATQPNILWITCEDISPDLPVYGDTLAHAPNLNKLAAQGCTFTRAFATSPVCSASRSAIITGIYATTIGTHQHRSMVDLPAGVRTFPAYLRDAGYYCTNNFKTDYNFEVPADAWDANGRHAHWKNRPDPQQPFFAVFNFIETHEAKFHLNEEKFATATDQVSEANRTNPQAVKLPPYIPDTPITRRDWARYYDMIAQMDTKAGELLAELDAAGLSTNTLVVYFSDHGRGLPRGKRWLYDSGIQVPLIVRWPGHIAPASRNGELVSLLDMAPTMLAAADITPPDAMQGRVIFGDEKETEPKQLFQTRDRMDETHDMIRSVRDNRFKYIKNFHPEKPYDQIIEYVERNPTMKELRRLHQDGTLTGSATLFFQPSKPAEELYDTKTDPHEIKNLAADPAHSEKLNQMRQALATWQKETKDRGHEPEKKRRKRTGKAI